MERIGYIYIIVLVLFQHVECADQPNQPPTQQIYYVIPADEQQQSQNQPQPIPVQTAQYYGSGYDPSQQTVYYYDPFNQPAPAQYYVAGPQASQPVQVQYDGITQQPISVDSVPQQVQYMPGPQPTPILLPQYIQPTSGPFVAPPQQTPIQQYDPYQQYVPVQHYTYYGPQPVEQAQPQQVQHMEGPQPIPVIIQGQVQPTHAPVVVAPQTTQQPYGPYQQPPQQYMPSGYQLPIQTHPTPIQPEQQPITVQQYPPYQPYQQPLPQYTQAQPMQQPLPPQPTPTQPVQQQHQQPLPPQPTPTQPIQQQPIRAQQFVPGPKPIQPRPQPRPQPIHQQSGIKFRPPRPRFPFQRTPQQRLSDLRGYQLPFPELREPYRSQINIGPGILGPAPGQLRHPIYTTQGFTSPTPAIEMPHTPPQTTGPTKPQPSEPSEPSKPAGPSEPLQPEVVPVEMGSDDEEAEKEEGAVGGAGGGDEKEEDEDDEDKPAKPSKICETISFMKKGSDGELTKMTDEDYYIKWTSPTKIKYVFKAELEALLCDEQIIFRQIPGKEHCQSMIYHKAHSAFILIRSWGYVLVKFHKGDWRIKIRSNPEYVKLYTLNELGNEVQLGCEAYYLQFTTSASFKFIIYPNNKLTKLVVKNEIVWEKTLSDGYPKCVTITNRMNVMIFFDGYIRIYAPRNGRYKYLFTSSNIKSINKP